MTPTIHGGGILLMYLVLPVWILAGFTDYCCHRASRIQDNAGTPESVLHLVQYGSVGLPVVLALLAQINALFFLIAMAAIIFHHAVAYIDVRYANSMRTVSPFEQMVHSFLEIMPITAFLLLAALYWDQFSALLGQGAPDFRLAWKARPLPVWYVTGAIGAAALFNLLPYLEELARCRRAAPVGR